MWVYVLGRETADGRRFWYSHVAGTTVVWVRNVQQARAFDNEKTAQAEQRMLKNAYGVLTWLDEVELT